MITANENDLVEPMVLVSLSEHDELVKKATKTEILTYASENGIYINKEFLQAILGTYKKEEK